MKKLVLTPLFFITSTFAMASAAFDGMNARVGVGFASIGNGSTLQGTGASLHASTAHTSVLGSVAGGYSYQFNKKFSLGAQLFYHFGSSDAGSATLSSSDGLRYEATVKNVWGLLIEPGYFFTDQSIGLLKFGFARASTHQAFTDKTGTASIDTGHSNGFLYGVGFTQQISRNLFVGVDACQIAFASTATNYQGARISSKPNYTYGGISIGYRFGSFY